jgi:MFS family permease
LNETIPLFVRSRRAESRLQTSLLACSAEGIAAEVVWACSGGPVIAAWALAVDAGPFILGLMWGLPFFGQILQVPASWLTSRFGKKRVCVVANAIGRQATLPLALLPFVDLSSGAKRAILVTLFATSSLLAILGHNAWLAWMGDLVPGRVRGAYFGRRGAMTSGAATLASVVVAVGLEAGRARAALGVALAVVVVARSIAAAATTLLMLRQHEPPGEPPATRLRDLAAPVADPAYRRVLAFRAAWGAASGLSAGATALFMVRAFGLGFLGLTAYAGALTVLRVVTSPAWGRALDRSGARAVLVASSVGMAAASFAWLGAVLGHPWLVALDALVAGLCVGGQELAMFTLPLASARSALRPQFAAANVMIAGVAFGLACVAGGALADRISLPALVLVSALGRVVAAAMTAGIAEPTRRADSTPHSVARLR